MFGFFVLLFVWLFFLWIFVFVGVLFVWLVGFLFCFCFVLLPKGRTGKSLVYLPALYAEAFFVHWHGVYLNFWHDVLRVRGYLYHCVEVL